MDTSAIVLNHFGADDTIACVHSLLLQGLDSIHVLENSPDEREFQSLSEAFRGYSNVILMRTDKNLGFSRGVNSILKSIGGDPGRFFLLVNNDTVIPEGTLTLLRDTLISREWAFAAPVIQCYPEVSKLWSKGSYYNKFLGLISTTPVKFLPGNHYYVTGCCLLIRGEVFRQIGLFDESFFVYGEDIEFCFRASQSGLRFGTAPEVRIFHKASRSSVMNSPFYEYHMNRAHLLLCDRLASNGYELTLSLLIKMANLLVRALLRFTRFHNDNALRAYGRVVGEFLVNPRRFLTRS